MPLVVMVGLPCCGKTRRAHAIAAALSAEVKAHNEAAREANAKAKDGRATRPVFDADVAVINEEGVAADRNAAYKDAAAEKIHRGNLLSAVERLLTRDKFVILDSMNYIKGFRYQLHCVAKGLATPQYVIFCMATTDQVHEWNSQTNQYSKETFASLMGRLEEPEARNRWDSPLLALMPDDELPASFIHSMVHASVQQAPSQSIALKPLAETNYLHEMDQALKSICDAVLEASRSGLMSGGELKVPGTDARVLVPSKGISVSEIGRLKRLYASNLNRLTIKVDRAKVAEGFVEYINQNL
ncbi:chromatin associated protein KTI12, partial [Chytriomyces sp. MP71]